ncbi:hypothetical protein ACROYT_G025732 [Oculina patagonica]
MTPRNEGTANRYEIIRCAVHVEPVKSFPRAQLTNSPKYRGSTSNPTPRSETARFRSNVFRGFGTDEVLLSAWIVTQLNTMAVMASKAFNTQLAMYHESLGVDRFLAIQLHLRYQELVTHFDHR